MLLRLGLFKNHGPLSKSLLQGEQKGPSQEGGVVENTSGSGAPSVPDQAVDVVLGSAFTGGDFKDVGSTQQQFLSVPVCYNLPEQVYTVGWGWGQGMGYRTWDCPAHPSYQERETCYAMYPK